MEKLRKAVEDLSKLIDSCISYKYYITMNKEQSKATLDLLADIKAELNLLSFKNKAEQFTEDVSLEKTEETQETQVNTPDMVNNPPHYKGNKFQCIDVMLDVFGKEKVSAFCKLNAFKYLYRADKKNGLEDMKKAEWYINKYIELNQ